jgi:DUF1680 family protein
MKRLHPLAILISLSMLLFTGTKAQTIRLPKECKFKYGDDIAWASATFNDRDWEKKKLGEAFYFENKTDNYGWFRIKVVIPSSIKLQAEQGNGVQLSLGKIDDIDQTFFNGKQLGQTGSFPPNYESKSQISRQYTIPVKEVQWDMENIIAVRSFSPDSWMGLYDGPYQLAAAQWSDFVTISQNIVNTNNNGFITKLKFSNNGIHSFDGTILYQVLDKNKKQLFFETRKVHVASKPGTVQETSLSNFQSTNHKVVSIVYQVKENGTNATVSNEHVYLVDRKMQLDVNVAPKPFIKNKIHNVYESVDFNKKQLRGYLGNRMYQNLSERLLKVDEAGILDGYLERPGHHPWAGEHVGKYLEAASNVWRNTGNAKLKMQMDQIMLQLISSQLPDGYLGTYLPADYWTSWDVWSHKYNLYGLLAYYKTTGYLPALETCKKMGNLLCKTFGNLPGQLDIIQAGTHVGMAATSVLDPMVELYKYMGDKKYLDFCYYIISSWEQKNGPKIISSLLESGKVTKVGNAKAYEMLSNFVGIANLYQVTGDAKLLKPVLIAWEDIVKNRLYLTGSTSSREFFQDDHVLPAGKNDNMGEGCVTTTWIQLNHDLFSITGDVKYMEQIERSVYNHLLAAENPATGCVSYYTSLMEAKPFNCEITCCTSSVPRGIAMIPYFIYGNLKDIPTLLMYEPGVYINSYMTSKKKKIDFLLNIESDFPESGSLNATINTSSNKDSIPIAFRVPGWCSSFVIKVGDEEFRKLTNNFIIIKRTWNSGEKIKISFDIPLKEIAGGNSYPGKTAFQRGPQILALDESLNQNLIHSSSKELKQSLWNYNPDGKNCSELLPKQWIGKQAYSYLLDHKNQLILVPFADAGQTGASLKVWMPIKPIE